MSGTTLIVDDSLTVRMDLAESFEAAGLQNVACGDLASARAVLTQQPIGLVVLDVLLPDGDGIDLLEELRASPALAALPVLLLSSEAEVKHRIRGLRMGASEFVGKPYDTRYVVAKARELLGGPALSARPTVLVIDDSDNFRHSLREALIGAGYDVLEAEDGRTGLAMIADRRPAAVLVDGVMPDIDGATVIRRVRLDAATRALPCLLLTGHEDATSQLGALEAGADAFVRKDGDMAVILARLGAVMRRSAETAPEPVASLIGARKILAVDDSPTYLNELADLLRGEGYEVSLAHSGEEAIELLAVQPVDCILMDLMMPGIGGREACVRIKAAQGLRDIPLILLTAQDERQSMLDGLEAGADDYLSKATEFEVLGARILAQIRRKQFEDEHRRHREDLMVRELEAGEQRAARVMAESRAAMVDELERTIEQRTRELEAVVAERRQAERMASVGILSASIAHEINNPLAVVSGNLDVLQGRLHELTAASPGREAAELLADAEALVRDGLEAAERVRAIVGDLRIFSRSDSDGDITPTDVRKVLESALRMATNEIRHRARLIQDFVPTALVLGNDSRLGQVFLNLIVNAAQAIPVGQAERNQIRVSTAPAADGFVAVEVTDTGVGIPEDKLARIFDPFFTTKPAAVGLGLGLAICQRIVSEVGGRITVQSTVGQGTTFRVLLREASGVAGATATAAPAAEAPVRHGRVMVIDDEPALCATFERILKRDHEVMVFTSARAATDAIGRGERFDAIVSDLMMPEMTGMELHAGLVRLAPDQAERMIFMTGGSLIPETSKFLADPGRICLEKPFRAAALRQAVQTVIEAGAGGTH